ncbi:MAG: VOC family protein [Steroidobacteraceae bacterium]
MSGQQPMTATPDLRLDHVMIAVRDMDDAIGRYQALGFNVRRGGRHPGRGTENAVMRFDWEYFELIAVHDPAERALLGEEGAGLTTFLRKCTGGPVDPVFSTTALETLLDRFTHAGVPVTGPVRLQRVRPDGIVVANRCFQPGGRMSTRQLYPGFIQWDVQDPERLSGEWAGSHELGAREVAGLAMVVTDLGRARAAYVGVLGLAEESEDEVPALGARRVRCRSGRFVIDLLMPTAPGPVASELQEIGEGPFELRLRVTDLAHARQRLAKAGASLQPAPGVAGGYLVSPQHTLGARLVLVE